MKIKIIDILLIFIVAGLTLYSAYGVYMKEQGNSFVLIRALGSDWIFPVDAEETIIVEGVLGETVIQIGGKRAWVESSPCDNKTCVTAGFVSRQGQWAACLPNNVLLMIQGEADGDSDVDAIVW